MSAARRPQDYYATPGWAVRAVLPHLPLGAARILEPAAGDGAIVRELLAAGVREDRLLAVEIDEGRSASVPCDTLCADFLALDALNVGEPGLIVTNPPFSLAYEFVQHALKIVPPGGTVAMLLRLGFLEGRKRAALHRGWPADLLVLPRRPSFTGTGTDASVYAWYAWGPGRGGRWQLLEVER